MTTHPYECFWNSSVRPTYNTSVAGSVIGALGQPDGATATGSSVPNVGYQRPALYKGKEL